MTVGSTTASSSVSGRLFRGGTAKRYNYNACITISWATRRWAPASLVAQDDKVEVASRHLLSIQPVTHPVQYDGAPGREQRNPQTADDGAWLRPMVALSLWAGVAEPARIGRSRPIPAHFGGRPRAITSARSTGIAAPPGSTMPASARLRTP